MQQSVPYLWKVPLDSLHMYEICWSQDVRKSLNPFRTLITRIFRSKSYVKMLKKIILYCLHNNLSESLDCELQNVVVFGTT